MQNSKQDLHASKSVATSPKISFFKEGIKHYSNPENIYFEAFVKMIKEGKYASKIEALRTETDKQKAINLKNALPNVTTSGIFLKRNAQSLLQHSGLMQIDFDKLPAAQKASLRLALEQDEYILSAFDSPTNTGLKAVVKIPAQLETHLQSFYALENYFFCKYEVQIDKQCKDISRAMFVSYDSNIYYNPESKVFETLQATESPDYEALHKAYTQEFGQANYQKGERHEDVFSMCVEWVQRKRTFADGEKSKFRFCLACLLCEFGVSEKDALAYITENYASATGEAKDRGDVRSAYKKAEANKRTFVPYSKYVAHKPQNNVNNEVTKEPKATEQTDKKTNIFSIKPMNEFMQSGMKKEPLKKLFGEFIKTNELTFLFGDNGTGKSLLMVQVANEIAKGNNPLGLENEHAPQKVLYFDFELTDRNFAKRYGNRETGEMYNFSPNFLRCEIDLKVFSELPSIENYTETLVESIKAAITEHGAKVVVIDNVTGISLKDLGKVEYAVALLQKLNILKHEFGVTLVVLAHPTKQLDFKPLQKTQLSGSKKMSDLADSIFAIGKCAYDESLRYLIDLKNRNGESIHHKNNVFVMRKVQEPAFVGFKPEGTMPEKMLLLTDEELEAEKEKATQDSYVFEMWESGTTQTQIAKKMGISQGQVSKVIDKVRQQKLSQKSGISDSAKNNGIME